MSAPDVGDALRYAARVADDPAHAIRHWRAVTGGVAAGCLSPMPVPEILHAAGMLPVRLSGTGITHAIRACTDAWICDPNEHPLSDIPGTKPRFDFPAGPFPGLAHALDLLESMASWAGSLAGRPPTEGALWKSIHAFRHRGELLRLLAERGAGMEPFLPAGAGADLVRAGDFLPPESHSRLLETVLEVSLPAGGLSPEEERGDPLLWLSRRLKVLPDERNA